MMIPHHEEEYFAARVCRVLRRTDSQEYFTGDGWTRELHAAWRFGDSVEAARICARHGLTGVELVLQLKPGAAPFYSTDLR
jgi:hypothetical protein